MKLSEIGDKFQTLKNTHITCGKKLLDLYEPFFSPIRDKKEVNILEIGVLGGSSLKTWKEYFMWPCIIGIDIDPAAINYAEDRIQIEIGSQADVSVLEKAVNKVSGGFDIIIDDGSHINEYTLASFNYLWNHLVSGGIYILEDMICSYDKVDMGWPGMNYNQHGTNPNNTRADIDNFLNKNIHQMDRGEYSGSHSEIFGIHIYRNVIIIEKK